MTREALLLGMLAAPALASIAGAAEPAQGLAALSLAGGWLGRPVAASDLRGRAVLVDVFTYECINCVRVLPNLKRLYAAYPRSDLAIVGVHTPEVPSYQARSAYLERQTERAEIPWPIAIDNGYKIWNAYGVSAWPTILVFDRRGRWSATVVGDGSDEEVDAAIRKAVSHGD